MNALRLVRLDSFVNVEACSYLEVLTMLLIKFIEGQALESMSARFAESNATVNANCCELLEELLPAPIDPPVKGLMLTKSL